MDTTEILKRVKKIEITTKKMVNELFSGEYHSLFKGQGLEFTEVREYQYGDSFREIDWNVSAKMGHPYVKKFKETRELNVIFLVDCSKSTLFGTRGMLKAEYIAELTAVLSFSALSNNDKVGLLLFTDEVEKYIPPRKGKKAALRIIRDILYYEPRKAKTDIAMAVRYIAQMQKRKSIIFILSDFEDKDYEDKLSALARKHDVIALNIQDEAELNLPESGLLRFYDPETNEIMTISANAKNIAKINLQLQAIQKEMTLRFKKSQIDLISLKTNEPYIAKLMTFFKQRIRQKNR